MIALAADKVALADYLGQHNLPVPAGCSLAAQQLLPGSFPYPGILKPRYGAGSAGLSWIEDAHCEVIWDDHFSEYRLEQYCPGIAVSVAVLRGPAGVSVLPACQQLLSRDDRFQYLGGTVPIAEALARRAERLALRVVDVLPPSVGYLGIDFVLGETEEADRIIEINPRLTTSYVGLSQLTKGNLAEAMLGVALGATCTLRFRSEPVWFDATGAGVAVEDHCDSPATRQGVRA